MGGCRCVYRSCQNSTAVSPGLHYFHFPVRDPPRCELWIQNAQKPAFRKLDKDKLRNKVICSLHFEERCFTNEKHDRLIHSAFPSLGFEDDIEQPEPDPLTTQNNYQSMGDDNIMLIPIDDDNTKFALPNVEFAGMSYTIFDDAVIPTSKIEEVIINELKSNSTQKPKELQIKSVVKKIKTNLPTLTKAPAAKTMNRQDVSQFSVFKKSENNHQIRTDLKIVNTTVERSNNNIPSYSVSTLNGDVSVAPSTHILPDILTENVEEHQVPDFQNNSSIITQANLDENSSQDLENISLQLKKENEYTMSVTPVGLIQNLSNNENSLLNNENSLLNNENSQETIPLFEQPTVETTEKIVQTIVESVEDQPEDNIKKEYVRMIKDNTKQIKQLKRLVQKQSKLNRMIWQRKQMPHFKQRRVNKMDLIDSLKDYVKPSLLAILKLELLPVEEVVLSDQEEKFITDLYTENPECYDLLRTKFKWNLPSSERIDEPLDMQCD